jgi:hypothetical protein
MVEAGLDLRRPQTPAERLADARRRHQQRVRELADPDATLHVRYHDLQGATHV